MEFLFDAGVLLLCVGALVLVALVAFVFRALTRPGRGDAAAGPTTGDRVDPLNPADRPVDRRGIDDSTAAGFGGVPTTGAAREYDTESGTEVNRGRVDEDVTLGDPGLDRDRPPYDRDVGDIDDDDAARRRTRRDDEI
jgi:hypothetical protein